MSEEQRLIDGLFSRLKQAESQTHPRDSQAEELIQQHIRQQPAAPYYMAQSLIIQEAALKQLDQKVKDLEAQITQLQQSAAEQKPQSGGFLAGLFGGGSSRPAPTAREQYQAQQQNEQAWNNNRNIPGQPPVGYGQPQASYAPQPAPGYAPAAAPAAAPARSFLGGALQTAAGVAGGVVLADMLTGMFRHSQPEEIVNIINEPSPNDSVFSDFNNSNNLDTFNDTRDSFGYNNASETSFDDNYSAQDDSSFGDYAGDDEEDDDSFF